MCKDETYVKKLGPYVHCWENIFELLSNPLPTQSSMFLEGFQPSSNWRFNYLQSSILAIIDIDHEGLVIIPYYGAKNMRLSLKIIEHSFYKLGHWRFCSNEAYKFRNISCVNGKGGK